MNANSIIKYLLTLDKNEQQKVFNFLEEKLIIGSLTTQIKEDIKENRFASGKVCPHCKSNEVSRNGKYKGRRCRSYQYGWG